MTPARYGVSMEGMGRGAWLVVLASGCTAANSSEVTTDAGRPSQDATHDGRRSAVDAPPPKDVDAAPARDAGTAAAKDAAADGNEGAYALQDFVAGTNLSGAEFGTVPGVYQTNYTYPTPAEVQEFTADGFTVFRIPFLWERMQPTLNAPLDTTQLGYLTSLVADATSKGAYVDIDVHNYARYNGHVIGEEVDGGTAVTTSSFADLWRRLAAVFADNPHVVFGLMNEPNGMTTELWLSDANAAIAAIRQAGAKNLLLVPGNGYTGAWTWTDNGYGTADSVVMLGVEDPLDNYVYEMHQYLDSDSSGTSSVCVSSTVGSERLTAATQWLEAHHARGFLGEFGVANNPTCISALSDMLTYVDAHRDAWAGWTWWSAGPWWGSYMFSIEPTSGVSAPQTATLMQHL